jgi:TorA maturation chaperone TorD
MHEIYKELADKRSKVYWFLSDFYNLKPTMEFLKEIRNNLNKVSGIEEVEELVELRNYLDNLNEEGVLELQVLFTRLMRGIKEGYSPPPPYESVYRENKLCGEWTLRVMEFYNKCGFGIIDETVGPQDHITAELKFISFLCIKEREGWENCQKTIALQWMKMEEEFLKNHVLVWVPRFCRIIESEKCFYSSVAKLTRKLIEEDFHYINDVIEENLYELKEVMV